jgi:serine/threonine-protein kinase
MDTPPSRLGPYEILSRLGKGGMGEVWKAHDPRLNRDVAIKVSAQQFTDRFEREARAIAALNHPNICTLYDVGPNYLVMELVEGPTLAARIAEGPIPLEEALRIAKQIADALEAAHDKAIVHRDLKPANIKIKPDGQVKVLDFGLAKSAEQTPLTPDSPTMLTVAGMILGTAGYMSPEQARGKDVDKRADIWAFGVVLYEMLPGQRLFEGETVSDTLAAVIKEEPDLTKVPAKVQRLLRRCLEKDPKKRLRDITGAEFLLEDAEPAAITHSKLPWIAAALFAFAAASMALIHFREAPLTERTILFIHCHSREHKPGIPCALSRWPPFGSRAGGGRQGSALSSIA